MQQRDRNDSDTTATTALIRPTKIAASMDVDLGVKCANVRSIQQIEGAAQLGSSITGGRPAGSVQL